jgi:hypothetical protein
MEPYEKIAKILRTDKDFIKIAAERLQEYAKHNRALPRIIEENEREISNRLDRLGIKTLKANEINRALIDKVKQDDSAIFNLFRRPTCDTEEGCATLIGFAKDLAGVPKGHFLKREKAIEFLHREPPENILSFFKFKDTDELLKNYDLFEVYSALRFVENKDWLNDVFFKQLNSVRPEDFEEREIEVRVLHKEWLRAAEKFIKKKYHNVSHLKELGIIFVIPLKIDTPGETLRVFSLILHYLHEVTFYSKLFRKYAREDPSAFSRKLVSALRGDVLDSHFSDKDRGRKWMIVQRYLAKDDPYDWRLFEPHVNPEAIHWSRAEDDIARLGMRFGDLGLDFWSNLDYVGDYYYDEAGTEVLVSFNLIDTVMSLVQEREMVKYLYHHQEALWNKIFSEYIGRHEMEKMIVDGFDKGYIQLG